MSLRSSEAWGEQASGIFTAPREKVRGRRSRMEMTVDVIRAIHGGAERPTQVMYRSNLSWLVCQELLKHLSAKGFVRAAADGDRRLYGLTSEGVDVLWRFAKAAEEIGA